MSYEERGRLKAIVAAAAAYRSYFPYGGFETLDTTEIQVLVAIEAKEKSSPKDVAKSLGLDPTSISGPLSRMAERKLIKVTPDRNDARRRFLKLTAGGRRLVHSYLDQIDENKN